MRVCGVVCEYNPFHNGHLYQIQKIRESGYDTIVGIMSGNFVQRGDVSIFDKKLRASAAVSCGMDLVFELPSPYSLSSAEGFAKSSVYILSSLGQVDALAFGTEEKDPRPLYEAAKLLAEEPAEFKRILRAELSGGSPVFSAREKAVRALLGDDAANALSKPNNILAVEYLKALYSSSSHSSSSSIIPLAIPRIAAEHDEKSLNPVFSSATAIRESIKNGDDRYFDAVPEKLHDTYKNADIHNIEDLNKALLVKLLCASPEDIKKTPDVSEGLENKIKRAAIDTINTNSFAELCGKIKSKRYAHSRIRRILLRFLLGITSEKYNNTMPKYIKILDFGENGQRLIHEAKKTARLPLAKNRNGVRHDPIAADEWDAELMRDEIYRLSRHTSR